jgi:hypothetical protein
MHEITYRMAAEKLGHYPESSLKCCLVSKARLIKAANYVSLPNTLRDHVFGLTSRDNSYSCSLRVHGARGTNPWRLLTEYGVKPIVAELALKV